MSKQYDLYLENHKKNVEKGANWFQEHFPEIFEAAGGLGWLAGYAHDASKTNPDEYDAYDRYFYGGNRSYQVVQDFNKAWLMHIHRNPHHWQHWVLINDDAEAGTVALDMPFAYILEMICDWWSFSWEKGDLNEIFKWYEDHRERIIFSDKTRKTVEDILAKMKEEIEK